MGNLFASTGLGGEKPHERDVEYCGFAGRRPYERQNENPETPAVHSILTLNHKQNVQCQTNLSDQFIPDKNILYLQVSMYDRIWLYGM